MRSHGLRNQEHFMSTGTSTGPLARLLGLLSTADGPRPDVILLDSHMPGMDGASFARAYTALTHDPAPIVLLSGDSRPLDDDAHGIAARVAKPFDIDRLLAVVHERVSLRVRTLPPTP